MLCAFCVIGFGWTVHGDFGKRNVFTGDAAHQGAECCLGETFLRSEKDFFEAVISVAAAVACDKSTGLGEDNVVACSSDFECQFVYGFKFDHKYPPVNLSQHRITGKGPPDLWRRRFRWR